MANRALPKEDWFVRAALLMVQDGLSLRQAALECGISVTSGEAEIIERRKAFQSALWKARNAYWEELGASPTRNKYGLLGKMEFCIQRLMESGSWDKAIEGCLKLAKVEGFVGAESEINVFGGLTQKELEAAKKDLTRLASLPKN